MAETIPIIKIENVVASATINQRIDLIEITKKFTHAEYNPKQFPGLVFRIKDPKTAILIFSSGKMVCTGGKSEKMAKIAIKSVVSSLKEKEIREYLLPPEDKWLSAREAKKLGICDSVKSVY